MATESTGRAALLFITLAFQLHALCMAISGTYNDADPQTDDLIKAFLILAFALYTATFILCVVIYYADVKYQISRIFTVISGYSAVICMVIGVSIYGEHDPAEIEPFPITTYVISGVCGAIGSTCILVEILC